MQLPSLCCSGTEAQSSTQLDGSIATEPQPALLASSSSNGAANGSSNGATVLPDAPAKPGLDAAKPLDLKLGLGLDERILSGEFGDEGSTKERLLRPLRKLLARDRVGPGTAIPDLYHLTVQISMVCAGCCTLDCILFQQVS